VDTERCAVVQGHVQLVEPTLCGRPVFAGEAQLPHHDRRGQRATQIEKVFTAGRSRFIEGERAQHQVPARRFGDLVEPLHDSVVFATTALPNARLTAS
jgi:hypothetical protein